MNLTAENYHKKLKTLPGWQYAAAGGGSGAITRALFQPLDVLKIRFQLQVEPISHGSKYSSLLQATRTIIKEEGITSLWKGHIPAQCLSIVYGVAQFWTYEVLTAKIYASQFNNTKNSVPIINFTCGAVAGCFATTLSYPFDTVRTRMIAEANIQKIYNGMWHTFQHMFMKEGKLSFFKGLLPTIAQIAPHAGAQFMFYKLASDYLHHIKSKEYVKNDFSFMDSISAGSIAGFLAKLCIYPFDLARKRLQIQGFQHNREYFGKQFYCKGFTDCIYQTITKEGFLALYKGLYPSLIKATLVSSSHFTFFEFICYLFRSFNEV